MINICTYINFSWPLIIKWVRVTITHLLPNLYTVYVRGFFLYRKFFTAFLSPLYYFKLRLIFPDFNNMPMNRPEWNSI